MDVPDRLQLLFENWIHLYTFTLRFPAFSLDESLEKRPEATRRLLDRHRISLHPIPCQVKRDRSLQRWGPARCAITFSKPQIEVFCSGDAQSNQDHLGYAHCRVVIGPRRRCKAASIGR